MSFVEWLDANGHVPTNWQLQIAEAWDALHAGTFALNGGRRWGKTWLFERWREYQAATA